MPASSRRTSRCFCAATGLKTRPKASMDKARIKELLKLTDAQTVFLNHPVGYAK